MKNAMAMVGTQGGILTDTLPLTEPQRQAMDNVLEEIDVRDPTATVDEDAEMADVAPRAVQKQDKQKKDKKRDRKEKKEEQEL